MPVNSTDATKSVEKYKFSLSLNRNNASVVTACTNTNTKVPETSPTAATSGADKENKPGKRPLTSSTYYNTLQAAKRLKPIQETTKYSVKQDPNVKMSDELCGQLAGLNGHRGPTSPLSPVSSGPVSSGLISSRPIHSAAVAPIATLANLGNTCFLNSVLYTLRYAPGFVHKLHHLCGDLSAGPPAKTSSLGRSAAPPGAAHGTRSWSTRDLHRLGQGAAKTTVQLATEALHALYGALRAAEAGGPGAEPYAAGHFLAALRDVNSTFEGNRQQDAHEVLLTILDAVRETARAVRERRERDERLLTDVGGTDGDAERDAKGGPLGSLGSLRKSWKKKKEPLRGAPPQGEPRDRPGWDFVQDDFEGTMVVRTRCVECETVSERSQAVCELGVPLGGTGEQGEQGGQGDEPFSSAARTTEYLREQNKYWCGSCLRHVEARRAVTYSRLPRLLVLQLKRFSGGCQKITAHAPTPLELPCPCDTCHTDTRHTDTHRYSLWAVIMHLGASLSGGHYVAYVRRRASRDSRDSPHCSRDSPHCSLDSPHCSRERDGSGTALGHCHSEHNGAGGGFMRTLFNRHRPVAAAGCGARSCCVPAGGEGAEGDGGEWLSCDDDVVRPLSHAALLRLLGPSPSPPSAPHTAGGEPTSHHATPYLLFYARDDCNTVP